MNGEEQRQEGAPRVYVMERAQVSYAAKAYPLHYVPQTWKHGDDERIKEAVCMDLRQRFPMGMRCQPENIQRLHVTTLGGVRCDRVVFAAKYGPVSLWVSYD